MLEIKQRALSEQAPERRLTLPYDRRQKSRLRARLDSGEEVAIVLERGSCLRDGDRLLAEDGSVIEVVAASEELSVVRSDDAWLLSRAAYHLGNRHVPLQIQRGELRYQHDHVLDDMVRGLGLAVRCEQASFEPESGAYGTGHSHLSHGHGHTHTHTHEK